MSVWRIGRVVCVVLALMAASPASAGPLKTFDFVWSGARSGNTALGTGSITFDSATLPYIVGAFPGLNFLPNPSVTALQITITGATLGNGTFTLSDFQAIDFWSPAPLDLTTELVGQDLGNGCNFGQFTASCGSGNIGDFNIFGSAQPAPGGVTFFLLETFFASADVLQLVSMTPADVPEPLSLTLLGGGLLGIGFLRRRRE